MKKSCIRMLLLCFGLQRSTMVSSSTSDNPSLTRPFSDSFMSPDLAGCVTLYTRNQPEGCGTMSRDKQTGVVVEYDESNWQSPTEGLFVVLLRESLLTKTTVEDILGQNRNGQLQGILVTNETLSSGNIQNNPSASRPRGKRTASQALSYGNAYDWNPSGDGLAQVDFQGIPMVYLRENSVGDYLQQEAKQSDSSHSIKASFSYYMGPIDSDMDSSKCLQWRDVSNDEWKPKCQPLGGNSVWSRVGNSENNENRKLEDNNNEENNEEKNEEKPILLVASNLDGAALFHDLSFAANQAASNILTMILAAKLLGQVDLSSANKDIVLTLFQGEAFGYLGSRRFLLDIMGFECASDPVRSVNKNKDDNDPMACLYPLRPSLEFANLNGQNIAGMLAVDQLGVLVEEKNFYFHAEYNTKLGNSLSKILYALSDEDSYTISEAVVEGDDDAFDGDTVTIPPTPLTSLLSLSEGAIGGAVLSGYGQQFVSTYGSRHDTPDQLDYDAIAAAATTVARAAVAAAVYDDDSGDEDEANNAVAFALEQIPNALTASDETLIEVGRCLTSDASCKLLKQYAEMDAKTEQDRTGIGTQVGVSLGRSDKDELERSEPNYYVSVFSRWSGQPFVSVGKSPYGAYEPEDENSKQYGQHGSDAFAVQPSLLEQSVRGLFNDFLGRPANSNDLKSCESTSQCSEVEYCSAPANAICTGGKICVCGPQAHYHIALDEDIEATQNKYPGFFTVLGKSDKSALYTEPNWDNGVGVQIFVDGGSSVLGWVTLGLGVTVIISSLIMGQKLQEYLIREKLF